MAVVVPNQGEGIMLQNIVNAKTPENFIMKLYENNITPGETDTELTFTECTAPGYAAVTLTGASWGAPTEGDPTEIVFPQHTWTFTGAGNSQYGVFYVEETSGDLVQAERFAGAPLAIANNGDQIKVTPKINL